MQNNRYGLIGVLLLLIIGGIVAYWMSITPQGEVAAPDDSAAITAPQLDTKPADQAMPEPDKPSSELGLGSEEPASSAPVETQTQKEPSNQPSEVALGPVFDLLRVEPDGSTVIAGNAAPHADIEIVAGSKVLGRGKAGENGDFVVILDEPLTPGDHQLVLRARGADNSVAASAQTAVVSVPDNRNGQVLALVEEPGQASRLITKPETPVEKAPSGVEEQKPAETNSQTIEPAPVDDPIGIEAVEIEGETVFVAGYAKTGKDNGSVVVHANDILLGTSAISPEGRFLVQSRKILPVGDYIIRAELLDMSGRVLATARVPFRREAGENVSAIAAGASRQTQAAEDIGNAEPLQKAEGSVIIRKGDNLWTISKRTYGHGTRYTTIYLANRDQIRNPDLIWPGQVFHMPKEALPDHEVQRKMHGSVD